jgi:hypothetical protein
MVSMRLEKLRQADLNLLITGQQMSDRSSAVLMRFASQILSGIGFHIVAPSGPRVACSTIQGLSCRERCPMFVCTRSAWGLLYESANCL